MEYLNRECERIDKKYSQLFRNKPKREAGTNGTIFSHIRKSRETRKEDEKTAKQVIIKFMIFFNQCGLHVDFKSVDKMEIETLLLTYENLMEQEYQKSLDMKV